MKYTVKTTTRFKKSVRQMEKRGKSRAKLLEVVNKLAMGETLPLQYRDHALTSSRCSAYRSSRYTKKRNSLLILLHPQICRITRVPGHFLALPDIENALRPKLPHFHSWIRQHPVCPRTQEKLECLALAISILLHDEADRSATLLTIPQH